MTMFQHKYMSIDWIKSEPDTSRSRDITQRHYTQKVMLGGKFRPANNFPGMVFDPKKAEKWFQGHFRELLEPFQDRVEGSKFISNFEFGFDSDTGRLDTPEFKYYVKFGLEHKQPSGIPEELSKDVMEEIGYAVNSLAMRPESYTKTQDDPLLDWIGNALGKWYRDWKRDWESVGFKVYDYDLEFRREEAFVKYMVRNPENNIAGTIKLIFTKRDMYLDYDFSYLTMPGDANRDRVGEIKKKYLSKIQQIVNFVKKNVDTDNYHAVFPKIQFYPKVASMSSVITPELKKQVLRLAKEKPELRKAALQFLKGKGPDKTASLKQAAVWQNPNVEVGSAKIYKEKNQSRNVEERSYIARIVIQGKMKLRDFGHPATFDYYKAENLLKTQMIDVQNELSKRVPGSKVETKPEVDLTGRSPTDYLFLVEIKIQYPRPSDIPDEVPDEVLEEVAYALSNITQDPQVFKLEENPRLFDQVEQGMKHIAKTVAEGWKNAGIPRATFQPQDEGWRITSGELGINDYLLLTVNSNKVMFILGNADYTYIYDMKDQEEGLKRIKENHRPAVKKVLPLLSSINKMIEKSGTNQNIYNVMYNRKYGK